MQAHSLYTTDRTTIGSRSAGSSDPPLGSIATMLCSMTSGHLYEPFQLPCTAWPGAQVAPQGPVLQLSVGPSVNA
eukprot:2475408-Heterocapsa_arctica.AAC.1